MRFLGSNTTEMRWRPGKLTAPPSSLAGWISGSQSGQKGKEGVEWVNGGEENEGEWGKGKGGGISCIRVLPT